ncbi:hypothetical protein [Zunongwangia sp. HGR-M22]|uniref:hypothetical protein n=1 Tax=Zunongwangia sp. HGR-M22 TaxID=3015168 RepID=UPI0022DDA9B6|nr:hypothetical protein [Zunongwangia sp. HGR-M22]WBL25958.1 hypothetical protein PBT91_01385 [Zunongwangia sp. HGR-M22]
MKKSKLFLSILTIAALLGSCSDDDDNVTPGTDDDGGVVEQKDDVIDSQDDPDLDPEDLKGEVRADVTITADSEWMLTGALRVVDGATLTIEPGVTIKAQAGGTEVYMAILQGAKIDAQGTAEEPITITSAAENPRSGDWGGLILAGYANINTGEFAQTEVAEITYGGDNNEDNSGIIDYMIVEYTGARIGGTQEFNAITFYGVGSETSISNIMVRYGDDDGLEWFGGTVNVTNALVVNAKDDWFDWTHGWTGNGKNFYGIREFGFNDVTEDPRGIEADSNESNNDASPRSNPTIDGLTLYHQSTANMSDMIKIRRGSSATITNAVVAIFAAEDENAGTASDFIDLEDGSGNGSSETSISVSALGGIDATAIKNVGATITVEDGNTGADTSVFAWTGYDFPSLGTESED